MRHQANHQGYKYPKWIRQMAKRGSQAREAGAAYVMLLLTVAVMGIGLVAVSDVWHTTLRREKEQELLFIGDQFRQAIGQYYAQAPAGHAQRYPVKLEDMLKDPRLPGTKRYLRKIFADPMTGKKEWGLVRGPDGGILGVHSLSDEQPVKQMNFRLADVDFQGMRRYSDWVFIHRVGQIVAPPQKKRAQ